MHHSLVSKRFKSTFAYGSVSLPAENAVSITERHSLKAHGTDLFYIYLAGDLGDYFINFVNHLNPNGDGSSQSVETWPQYTLANPALMTFLDGSTHQEITQDTFRQDAIGNVTELLLKYPL